MHAAGHGVYADALARARLRGYYAIDDAMPPLTETPETFIVHCRTAPSRARAILLLVIQAAS